MLARAGPVAFGHLAVHNLRWLLPRLHLGLCHPYAGQCKRLVTFPARSACVLRLSTNIVSLAKSLVFVRGMTNAIMPLFKPELGDQGCLEVLHFESATQAYSTADNGFASPPQGLPQQQQQQQQQQMTLSDLEAQIALSRNQAAISRALAQNSQAPPVAPNLAAASRGVQSHMGLGAQQVHPQLLAQPGGQLPLGYQQAQQRASPGSSTAASNYLGSLGMCVWGGCVGVSVCHAAMHSAVVWNPCDGFTPTLQVYLCSYRVLRAPLELSTE